MGRDNSFMMGLLDPISDKLNGLEKNID